MANPDISQKTDKTRRKSLGMRLSTSAQFTGQIDRVRQNETLASVRHPQPPIYNLVPKADNLSSRLEAVLKDTVSKCKELIDDHTNHLIKEAEERISNPPVSAEQQVMNLIREQREMMNAQQEMYRSQTTHNMETILSAVSHLIKDAMKPSTAPKPDSENKTSW